MKPCPSCGTPNNVSARVCEVCGADMQGTIGRRPPTGGGAKKADALNPAATTQMGGEGAAGTAGEAAPITSAVDTIAGRYKLQEILGRGGVGVVYRARDLDLGEEIAIKVLQGQATRDTAELERFKREIITARKITHANVIRIHDFGMSGDEAFISMELLAGGTLADRIEDGAMDLRTALDITVGICEGLQAAHHIGIIHRVFTPDNVLFDAAGRPKLVDFGLARLASAPTRTIGFSGTPFYVSPEQAEGGEVGVRSDIYSLGVLLFEVFTGRLPFLADNLVRLALLHANEPPPKPRSVRPDLPQPLEDVILRCLEKEAARRYESAAAVAADLRAVRDGRRVATPAREVATEIRPMPVDDDATAPAAPRTPSKSRASGPIGRISVQSVEAPREQPARKPLPMFAVIGGAVLLLGAAGMSAVLLGAGRGVTDPGPTATPLAVETLATLETLATSATPGATPAKEPTPRNTPRAATPRPTQTRLAAVTTATPVPVTQVDLAGRGTGGVKFIGSKVLTRNVFPYVRVKELGLRCEASRMRKPLKAPTGEYSVTFFDTSDSSCRGKPMATSIFEVKAGKATIVSLDASGTKGQFSYEPLK